MMAVSEQARGSETKTKVFISYSRKDMAFADKLEAALKTRGFEVLIDRQEIYAFEDWWKRIQSLIGQSDTVVFVLSPDAVASEVALKKVAHAASLNKRFAPIVCRRVENAAVPEALRRLNFVFFDDPAQFEASADKLADALKTDIDWIRRHTEFGEEARRWLAKNKPDGLLLRSPTLEEAERWIVYRPHGAPEIPLDTRSFIVESRGGANRRRIRVQLSVAIVGLLAAFGIAAWRNQDWLREQIYILTNVHALTATQEQVLKPGAPPFNECTDCPEMVVVPTGSLMLGSPKGQGVDDEHPQHVVTIVQPFAVSKYELTFAEWDACGAEGGCDVHVVDGGFGRGRQPLINVSWDEAKQYAAWLSQVTGKTYRLLSEAEYEYATRAGATTAYPWGNDIKLNGQAMANCDGCGSKWDGKRPAPVGSFSPNKFGLYDMVGNVWEWTEDCYHDSYQGAPADGSAWTGGNCSMRAVRGRSWSSPPDELRSASRDRYSTDVRPYGVGFRVARTLDTR